MSSVSLDDRIMIRRWMIGTMCALVAVCVAADAVMVAEADWAWAGGYGAVAVMALAGIVYEAVEVRRNLAMRRG